MLSNFSKNNTDCFSLYNNINKQVFLNNNQMYYDLDKIELKNDFLLNSKNIVDKYFHNNSLSSAFEGENIFSRVKKGSIVLFKHVNKITHLLIKESQKRIKKGNDLFCEVTHAGILVDNNEKNIKISEIPGIGHKLTQQIYNLKELPQGEELLFTLDSNENLGSRVTEIAKLWSSDDLKDLIQDQYNIEDIILQPLSFLNNKNLFKIDYESKKRLVEAFIDTIILNESPLDEKKNYQEKRKFFCSEYVMEVYQMAWLDKYATLPRSHLSLKKQLIDFKDNSLKRKNIAEKILLHFEKIQIWKKLENAQFIGTDARDSSPSSVASVFNKQGKIFNYKGTATRKWDDFAEHAEFSLTRALDLYLSGEKITPDHPDVLIGLDFLEKRTKMSSQTTSCIKEMTPELSSCISKSLTWQEKFVTHLVSREIKRTLNQLQKEKVFQNICSETFNSVNQPKVDLKEIKQNMLENLFPVNHVNLGIVENYIVHYVMENISQEVAVKYALLAVLHDSSNDSVQGQLKEIIYHKNFSLVKLHQAVCANNPKEKYCGKEYELYVKIANSIIKSLKGKKTEQSPFETAVEVIQDLQEGPELKEGLVKAEEKTGYSQESLNCVLKDFIIKKNMPDIEECLKNTLTLYEKIGVLIASYRSNDALENFIETPLAKMLIAKQDVDQKLIDQLSVRYKKEPKEVLIDLFFPLSNNSISQKIKNRLYGYQFRRLNDNEVKHQFFKYIPLGLNFQPPSDKVQAYFNDLKKTPMNPEVGKKLPFVKLFQTSIELFNDKNLSIDKLKDFYYQIEGVLEPVQ